MRKLLLTALYLTLAFNLSTSIWAQTNEEEEIRVLLTSVAAYMQEGNLAALDEIFAPGPGVHIIEGAGVNHGWEEYRDHHLKPELEEFENFSYRFFAIEPQVRGEFAFAAFRYELTADIEQEHIEIEGRGTVVLEKISSQWRIVHEHTSGRRKDQ